MAQEEVSRPIEDWVLSLSEPLKNIVKNNTFVFYECETGPICFTIAMPQQSCFIRALESFYSVRGIDKVNTQLPIIYCLDENFINQLPAFVFRKADLEAMQLKSRLSSQKIFINLCLERDIIKVFNTIDDIYVFVFKDFDSLPSWEIYSPLKEFIHVVALKQDCWLAHAGSMGNDKEGVLLFGPGGNGKSTTTIACLGEGFYTAGDDYVLIDARPTSISAHAIYKTIKSFETDIFSFPKVLQTFEQFEIPLTGKRVYICGNDSEGPFVPSMKVKMLIGVRLFKSDDQIHNDMNVLNFQYFSLSTFSQIPFWFDKSKKIAHKIFDHIPHSFFNSMPGRASLEKNVDAIRQIISKIN
jgi:hypothetical protein